MPAQYYPDDETARLQLVRFSRLTSFSREADGARKNGRDPIHLTGGIILRKRIAEGAPEEFRLCVQPGCDAVGLTGKVAFPFCPMEAKRPDQAFDLIVKTGDTDKQFSIDRRPRSLKMIEFEADAEVGSVCSLMDADKRGFKEAGGDTFWEFVAELRALEAQHFTTRLVGQLNRIALNGSEWLRLHGGGDDD